MGLDDVPDNIREQLYAENQRLGKKKTTDNSTIGSTQPLIPALSSNESTRAKASRTNHGSWLLYVAVKEYTDWQRARIYEDQDPVIFVKHGVKVGAAQRFISDVGLWVKQSRETGCHENII
ncbi:hypothetical protein N7462_009772 [Penicillium macrosclerotiorum]|uniref:uncharacterized protein n=1 Tax=Penicillium macrosclerotiorum TaxID=303699 RepID=UPI002547A2DB|nr:uncharacterized protein N7462_009772 [Penicillium macrosclerotiorum]KAJ5668702.1 hypothetical protein N7462_009772 [Penicillium macrosclerotiorum]